MNLIQLEQGSGRAVACVDGAKPVLVPGVKSMLELAQAAIAAKRGLAAEVESRGEARHSTMPPRWPGDACCRRSTIPIRRIA